MTVQSLITVCYILTLSLFAKADLTKLATTQARELEECLLLHDPNAAFSSQQMELVVALFEEQLNRTAKIREVGGRTMDQKLAALKKDTLDRLNYNIFTKRQQIANASYNCRC